LLGSPAGCSARQRVSKWAIWVWIRGCTSSAKDACSRRHGLPAWDCNAWVEGCDCVEVEESGNALGETT
jgi:hypothetical protein